MGRLIAWKDVVRLARAFLRFWSIALIGCCIFVVRGEDKSYTTTPNIIIEDFVQPEELVLRYHSARFLILPSLVEAWGLVVHEAMLCGCGVVLSDRVGSAADPASKETLLDFKLVTRKSFFGH